MSVKSIAWLYFPLGVMSLVLAVVTARAESPARSPESVRQRRVELFVKAGQQPVKQMANDVFQFATDSERCRVSYGSKACGLPSDSLKGGDVEQVFDYYVRQPTDAVIDQERPSVQRQDWDWTANPGRSSDRSRDKQ